MHEIKDIFPLCYPLEPLTQTAHHKLSDSLGHVLILEIICHEPPVSLTPVNQIRHLVCPQHLWASPRLYLSAVHPTRTEQQEEIKRAHQLPHAVSKPHGYLSNRSIIFSPEHTHYQIWPYESLR